MKLFGKRTFGQINATELTKKQEIINLRKEILNNVIRLLALQKTISFYPEGPDKEKEKRDFENCKNSFLSKIAIYDDAFISYKDFCQRESQPFDIEPSHDYVRKIVQTLIT